MDQLATYKRGISHDRPRSGSGSQGWRIPLLERYFQFLTMEDPPILVSAWYFTAAFASALLAGIVYIYGWRRAGASLLMISPVYAYVMVSLLRLLWLAVFGPTATTHRLRLLAGALQTYYFIIPIFQPGSKVFFGELTAAQIP